MERAGEEEKEERKTGLQRELSRGIPATKTHTIFFLLEISFLFVLFLRKDLTIWP